MDFERPFAQNLVSRSHPGDEVVLCSDVDKLLASVVMKAG